RLGGLEIDDQLDLHRLFNGKLGRIGSLEDLVDVGRSAPEHIDIARRVRHQATGFDEQPLVVKAGESILQGKVRDELPVLEVGRVTEGKDGTGKARGRRREGCAVVVQRSHFDQLDLHAGAGRRGQYFLERQHL